MFIMAVQLFEGCGSLRWVIVRRRHSIFYIVKKSVIPFVALDCYIQFPCKFLWFGSVFLRRDSSTCSNDHCFPVFWFFVEYACWVALALPRSMCFVVRCNLSALILQVVEQDMEALRKSLSTGKCAGELSSGFYTVIWRLYRKKGKENGSSYLGFRV